MNQVHLLSKSIPRAGHHYTVNILKSLYGNKFFYCEFYQPSTAACCKKTPCLNRLNVDTKGRFLYPVSMQKSHDFNLTDKIYRTSEQLKYILFFRNFMDSIKSRTKLFLLLKNKKVILSHGIKISELFESHDKNLYKASLQIIDIEGVEISPIEFENFLIRAASHHVRFTKKWGAVASSKEISSLVIHYEDFSPSTEFEFANNLIRFIGIDPVCEVQEAITRCPLMNPADKKSEISIAATELMSRFSNQISFCSKMVEQLI